MASASHGSFCRFTPPPFDSLGKNLNFERGEYEINDEPVC